ncbi:hypothetical protein LTR17_020973 [Elasticomyces elasticus]|nr:hypothetical protein LTR17_020973 [Elasticomyces elasticus]
MAEVCPKAKAPFLQPDAHVFHRIPLEIFMRILSPLLIRQEQPVPFEGLPMRNFKARLRAKLKLGTSSGLGAEWSGFDLFLVDKHFYRTAVTMFFRDNRLSFNGAHGVSGFTKGVGSDRKQHIRTVEIAGTWWAEKGVLEPTTQSVVDGMGSWGSVSRLVVKLKVERGNAMSETKMMNYVQEHWLPTGVELEMQFSRLMH